MCGARQNFNGSKVTQNFQCRTTADEQMELVKAIEGYGFETSREFVMAFARMLNSGDITGHLRSFRLKEVDERSKK